MNEETYLGLLPPAGAFSPQRPLRRGLPDTTASGRGSSFRPVLGEELHRLHTQGRRSLDRLVVAVGDRQMGTEQRPDVLS